MFLPFISGCAAIISNLEVLGKRNLDNLIRVKLREMLSNFAASKNLEENSKLSLGILDENREAFLANAGVVLENSAILLEINFAHRRVGVVLLALDEAHDSIDDVHFFLQFVVFVALLWSQYYKSCAKLAITS